MSIGYAHVSVLAASFAAVVAFPGCLSYGGASADNCGALGFAAPAEGVTQGLAGVGACLPFGDDLCVMGCDTCELCAVWLRIWKSDVPVTSVDAAALACQARQPYATVQGDPWYEIALDPGYYMVCSDNGCSGFEVAVDLLTTLHVGLQDDPSSLFPQQDDEPVEPSWFYVSEPGGEPVRNTVALVVDCEAAGVSD